MAADREALYREIADVEIDVSRRTPQEVADAVVAAMGARR
jgi:hypothetical protein